MKGRVIKSTGSWYAVKVDTGKVYQSRLRGKFKQESLKTNNPIAVGDFVMLEEEASGDNTAVIKEILPRENYIIRKSTRKSAFSHILAANIDQAVLMATLALPRTSLGFIDRFLVSAESFRIPAVIILNKSDILEAEGLAYGKEIQTMYEAIGYQTAFISVLEDGDVDQVKEILSGKTSLLSGHSGVGKSSLMNRLIPDLGQKVGEVSTFANKGTHTTTFAEMFEIDPGTMLIDTPGIKELGLVDMEPQELSHYFPEMRALIGACRFHNCTHVNEPGCAVIEAVENGQIAATRFESYLSMLTDEDNRR